MITSTVIKELVAIVGPQGVLAGKDKTLVYDCDAYTIEKSPPEVVVLPTTTEQVAAVVRLANREGIPFVPRGAGTGLSGGALAHGGLLIALTRMNKILKTDYRNRRIVAEAGAINIQLTKAVTGKGYLYAPDPSSQNSCTLGGNVAENSGGPHTLKYGVTTNHVLGVKMVMPDGSIAEIGGELEDPVGYDLIGLIVGSEGTFGVVTEATVRMVRQPQTYRTLLAVFNTIAEATNTVSDIIAAGIIPAALEMMDQIILQAVEMAFHFGFPTDAGAVLLIELDGLEAAIDRQAEQVQALCEKNQAREVRLARTEQERTNLWIARKKGIGATGRLAPSCVTHDGVIPRTRLPHLLELIAEIGAKYGLRIANVFHAGDGNLHPVILFDERDPDQVRRVVEAGGEILKACVSEGGSVTGEHGIGVEKKEFISLMFTPRDLEVMERVKLAFNPNELCNPGKIFPSARHVCTESFVRRRGALPM
ncbi:MAG: FAD-binding protein [Armatimonadetes bacterium]|nr:FAD-binding protein [Armatimonadota bacterium]